MKIIVTNVYSYENKGDAAILIALLNEIRRVFPGSSTIVQTIDLVNDNDKYGVPIAPSLMGLLLTSTRGKSPFYRLWKGVTGIFGLMLYLFFFKFLKLRLNFLLPYGLKDFIATLSKADMIIGTGGGYLTTSDKSLTSDVWLFFSCLNFLTGYYIGKPVYLYSQSIGPLKSRLSRQIVKFALKRTRLVEVREDISFQIAKDMKIAAPVIRTSDAAFLLKGKQSSFNIKKAKNSLLIGVTVRNWFNSKTKMDKYLDVVAKEIDYLIDTHGATIISMPQVIAANYSDDDRQVASDLWHRVKNQDKFTMVTEDFDPVELIAIYSKMDIFIGTRMHSNIFALINHVPVMAIQYEHKTAGIMKKLGLSDCVLDINNIRYEDLRDKVDRIIEKRHEYRNHIKEKIVEQIQLSRSAIELIREDYGKL